MMNWKRRRGLVHAMKLQEGFILFCGFAHRPDYEPTADPVTCRNCLKRRDKEKKACPRSYARTTGP